MKNSRTLIILALIIATAFFFRIWAINEMPPGLWPDEAINANQAWRSLESGEYKLFYEENHGREGLYMNLIAFSFALFGVHLWSFKLIGILAGTLTVFGLYLMAKEAFTLLNAHTPSIRKYTLNPEAIALISSFFLAISFWHIHFSRVGFRAILTPLVLVFSVYFLLRGFQRKSLVDFAASGIIFGIGLHTYIGWRVAVGGIAIMLIAWFLAMLWRRSPMRALFLITVFAVGFLLSSSPMIMYFAQHPEDFIGRASGVSVTNAQQPLVALLESTARHLGMFYIAGDPSSRHNLPNAPQLFYPVGILFLIGLSYATRNIFRSFIAVIKQRTRESLEQHFVPFVFYRLLFIWIFFLLLPGILTYEGIPHSLRVLGVIPAVYLVAGLGGYLVYQWGKTTYAITPQRKTLFSSVVVMLLLVLAGSTYARYFVVYANHPDIEHGFTTRFADVGYALNALPEGKKAYVIKSEGDLPVEVPIFIQKTEGKNTALYIEQTELETTRFNPGDIIFTMNNEQQQLEPLFRLYPTGTLQERGRFLEYHIN